MNTPQQPSSGSQPDYSFIRVESLSSSRIARIVLNRPEARNAQNRGLLAELHQAFPAAEADDGVRVVILASAGDIFSSGHDLGSAVALAEREPGPLQHETMRSNGGTQPSLAMPEWMR
jgi:enoyl-CoA hydratase